jgi:hypothetical protein
MDRAGNSAALQLRLSEQHETPRTLASRRSTEEEAFTVSWRKAACRFPHRQPVSGAADQSPLDPRRVIGRLDHQPACLPESLEIGLGPR